MSEFLGLSMLGGGMGLGAGFDIVVLLTFIATAVIYLIMPVVGYRSARRGGFVAALYLLIAYGVISLIQTIVMWTQMSGNGPMGRNNGPAHILMAFVIIKMMVYLAALVAFVSALTAARLQGQDIDD